MPPTTPTPPYPAIAPPPAPPIPAKPPRTRGAICALLLVAPLIPESLITLSTPVLNWVMNPLSLVFLMSFYGSAALLIRDVMRRQRLGWVSLALFGIAFGLVNEGVLAGTWYNSPDKSAGFLAVYGRAMGVNWVWAVLITLFHAIYSVAIPIALAEGWFPQVANRPWLGVKARVAFGILLALVCSIGLVAKTYQPDRAIVLGMAVALAVIAALLPPSRPIVPCERKLPGIAQLRWIGFGESLVYLALLLFAPRLIPWPPLVVALVVVVTALLIAQLLRWTRNAGWTLRQTVALATGTLIPGMIITGFFWQLGEPVLDALAIVLLVILARRLEPVALPAEAVA